MRIDIPSDFTETGAHAYLTIGQYIHDGVAIRYGTSYRKSSKLHIKMNVSLLELDSQF